MTENTLSKIEDSMELVPPTRYKDYLKEIKTIKNKNNESNTQKERDFQSEVKETKKIMSKSNYTEAEKLEQVKMVAERMETKSYSTNPDVLLKKIAAKMKIIGALHG